MPYQRFPHCFLKCVLFNKASLIQLCKILLEHSNKKAAEKSFPFLTANASYPE